MKDILMMLLVAAVLSALASIGLRLFITNANATAKKVGIA